MTQIPPFRTLSLATVLALMFWNSGMALGQSTYSPYSRFGLGKLQSGASIAQMGMGQMGAAWTDRSHLNTMNPAAAAFLTPDGNQRFLYLSPQQVDDGTLLDGVGTPYDYGRKKIQKSDANTVTLIP